MNNITFLEFDELSKLDVLISYGRECAITDFNILLGGKISKNCYTSEGINIANRSTVYYTKTDDIGNVLVSLEKFNSYNPLEELFSSRPIIKYDNLDDYSSKLIFSKNGVCEIEFGHYPQMVVDKMHNDNLERLYNLNKLNVTNNKYDASNCDITNYYLDEYEYLGNKYVRFVADEVSCKYNNLLSNGSKIKEGCVYWIKVEPIRWLVDIKSKTLICKKALFSNIYFHNRRYYGDFNDTLIYKYLNSEFKREILQNVSLSEVNLENINFDFEKYNLSFDFVSEEEIIRGCIEADIPVFLHGKSSEGKSARVKQIDDDLTIIYLRNSSPETLNGKSVYNAETGEMIDIKPTWLKKLESKCEREKDKLHILFFDEITNALPSIQGIAFNIVLDKEVNGIWKLPSNVRIVASGNEVNDSLSANHLAEPLFNRFAHVYIETKVDKWLEWANENNIHPAIYAFIAYKKNEALRSKYDGEKPNADPRKWEMASKMLYKTKNPEMLRSLIGRDITREFVAFCNQSVITLNDVLSGNYSEDDLNLNSSEKYSTIIGLLGVSKEDYCIVREFISSFGLEFVAIFNSLWSKDDPEKLEIIYEYSLNGGNSLCLEI